VYWSGYLDRWNVDKGGGGKDNGGRCMAEAMARHKFEGSRQGMRMRTTGADRDTRRGIELVGIILVSPIPLFASSFMVNNCGYLTSRQGTWWPTLGCTQCACATLFFTPFVLYRSSTYRLGCGLVR